MGGIESSAKANCRMSGGRMLRATSAKSALVIFFAAAFLAGCDAGATSNGSFDRTYPVSGPIRLDLSNSSGSIRITGSSDGNVHIHGDIRAHGFLFNEAEKRARELSANPPIEQKPDIIRVGKELSHFNGVSIDYTIELPRNAEVTTTVASGGQTLSDLQGPVKIDSASGSIEVSKVERSVQVNSASGSITAQDLSDDFRANSASGSVNVTNVKGDVRIHALSGSVKISEPGAR